MSDADGFVAPAYGRRSLVDVLPAVARALGVRVPDSPPSELAFPAARSYVVLLVDGLGHQQVLEHADVAPYLAAALTPSEPGTAGVPSTTATSLTSLGTALLPGEHGVVGFTSRIPGTDRLLNALRWNKDVDPDEWQPRPSYLARMRRAGVDVTVVNKREFRDSGLTRVSQSGVPFLGADPAGERLAAAVSRAALDGPTLTYLYDSDLDWTGHRHGVDSQDWRQQLAMTDAMVAQLRSSLPDDVGLVLLADHGMVDSSDEERVDVDQHPPLRDGVVLLGGEARMRHVYCRDGAASDVAATWQGVLGSGVVALTREDAVGRGWFGPLATRVAPRVGDVVVACRGTTTLLSSADFSYEMQLLGFHGSLTPAEMLVPLLTLPAA